MIKNCSNILTDVKKRLFFYHTCHILDKILGLQLGASGSFWLKCSHSIADQSLRVPSVSRQRKKFPSEKPKLIGPKSAMRVMRSSKSSNLLKTISQLKMVILKFVAKHLCIGILINQLCRSYLTSRKNGVLFKIIESLIKSDKKIVSS